MIRVFMMMFLLAVCIDYSVVRSQHLCEPQDLSSVQNHFIDTEAVTERRTDLLPDSENLSAAARSGSSYLEITAVKYEYNSLSDSVPESKTVNWKTPDGNTVRSVYYYWQETHNDWRPSRKMLAWFNEQDRFELQERYRWDAKKEDWKYEYREEYIYTDTSRIYTCLFWDVEKQNWVKQCRNETFFDDNGNILMGISKSWEVASEKWVTYRYSEYIYDEVGLLERTQFEYLEGSEELVPVSRIVRVSEGMNPEVQEEHNWDSTTQAWKIMSKSENQYDALGNRISHRSYEYDSLQNDYYEASTSAFEYDMHSNLLTYKMLRKNVSGELYYGYWEKSMRNEQGEMLLQVVHLWDTSQLDWMLKEKTFYHYSNIVTRATDDPIRQLTAYPNPSSGLVRFFGIEQAACAYELRSVSGTFILGGHPKNNAIDLTNVPQGVYFIMLQVKDQQHILKLIRQ